MRRLRNRSHDLTLATINGALNFLAQSRMRATYGYLAEHLGMHPHSTALWELLNETVRQDYREQKPYRAILIVNAETHRPGKLFMDTVRSCGVQIPDEEQFFFDQHTALGYTGAAPVLSPIY